MYRRKFHNKESGPLNFSVTKTAGARMWFFLGFEGGAAQGDFISQCAAVWIRTIKTAGNGEHMHFVSDNPGHFYGE